MERKFLEDLKLEKDAIDAIMSENGKDIEKHKTEASTAIKNLETATGTIKDLQDTVKKFDGVDVTKLQGDLSALQTKYETDTAQIKLDSALEVALLSGKAKNTKAVKALLDPSLIKLDGDKLLGLDEQLTKLKTDAGYLFDEDKPGSPIKVDSGKPHQQEPGTNKPESLLGALQQKYEKGE